ncbi:MAG: hypothetical protein M3387_14755 [Actinomycetota bacterium]|nr:hypothetical protein [Actinomycetota bacterium]
MNSRAVPDDVLSAYLADDLPDDEAAALEARLPGDPELAGRLDRMAAMLVELGNLDRASPPSGFDARLTQRLLAERRDDPVRGDGGASLAAAPVTDLDQIRRRRAARQRRWVLGGTVAAAVAAVALVSGLAVQELGFMVGGGGSSAGGAGEEAAGRVAGQGGGSAEDAATGESTEAGDQPATQGAPSRTGRPVVLDREVVLADEAAVRARYRALVEAERLLAAPLPQARAAADSAATFLRRSSSLSDALAPAECLAARRRDSATPVVPARVETVVYRGEPALAYVLVTASDGARELDRIQVEIVRAGDCSTVLSLRL